MAGGGKMKYAIYARVSPKGSGFENETSLEMQINFCKEYVKSQKGEIVDIQQDEFFSGKDMRRPGFQKLMHDLKSGVADWECLCVYKLSRLTRSSRDGAQIFEDLRIWNKGFISVTEPNFDFSTPMGRAMLSIFQAFNQFEREQTAENTRNKMISIAEQGGWPVGVVPTGYKRRGRHENILVIEPHGAEIIRGVYEMYAAGSEVHRIARKYRKSPQWVYHALKNKIYIGQIPYAGKLYQGKHERIISHELYSAVSKKLETISINDDSKRVVSRPKAYKYPYLLSGLLRCHCGRFMTPSSAKSGQYFYYRCTDNVSCKNRISAPGIEKKILDMMPLYEIDENFIQGYKDCIEHLVLSETERMDHEKKQVIAALSKSRRDQQRIIDLLISGKISDENLDNFNDRLFQIREEIKGFESRIDFLSSQIERFSNTNANILLKFIDEIYKIRDFFEISPENADLRRQFLTTCLDSIILEKDGQITLNFREFHSSDNDKNGCPIRIRTSTN